MVPILVFDIETIPDVEGLRRVWDLGPELSEQGSRFTFELPLAGDEPAEGPRVEATATP